MKRPLPFVAVLAVAAALAPARARACSVCGCGDPLVDVASSAPSAGRFSLSLGAQYLTASAQSDENPDQTESLSQVTLTPTLVYSPVNTLNLVLALPVQRKAWKLAGGTEPPERSTRWGLGDLDLGVRYFLWRHTDLDARSRQNLAIFAGSTFPTGPNDARAQGRRIDQHAQLGTGAFGPSVGVQYAFHRDPWNFFTSVSGQFHSTNKYDYHYASAVLWAVRTELRPWDFFAFELGVDGRYNGRDTMGGEPQVNTGGLVVALSPGALARIYDTLWIHLRVQVPVVTVLNGVQSVGPTYEGILQYTFH